MKNKNVSIENLLQFVYKPFDEYTLDDLHSLVEQLEYYIAFPDRAKRSPGTRATASTSPATPASAAHSSATQRIAEVGLSLLTEEIRIRRSKETAGR